MFDLFFILDCFINLYRYILPLLSISKFSLYWFLYFLIVDLIFKCISVLFFVILLLNGRVQVVKMIRLSVIVIARKAIARKLAKRSKLCTGNG